MDIVDMIRLVDGNGRICSKSGRVEILQDGKWGMICRVDFNDIDAKVACRELGLRYFS